MAGETVNWTNPLTGIIGSLLGGQVDQDINKTETATKTGTATIQDILNQIVTGNTSNTTQGTSTSNTTGTTNNATTGTSTQDRTGTSSTQTVADIARLQDVYSKQASGITPEMLAAIFTEGQKQVPGLTTAYANAVGARGSDNTPLATALTGLNASLTNQAAVLNNQLLKDSGATAAQIAEFTKAMNTVSNDSVVGTNNSTTTGTNTATTDTVNNSTATGITNQNTSSTGTKDVATTDTSNSTSAQSMDQTTNVDKDMLKLLAGLGVGTSALDTILGGNGVAGGLNDLAKIVTGVGGSTSLGSGIKNAWDSVFGTGAYDADLATLGVGLPDPEAIGGLASLDGLNFNPDGSLADVLDLSAFDGSTDWFGGIDWGSSLGATDLFGNTDWTNAFDFGWADGGMVDAQKSTAQAVTTGGPSPASMTPEGRQALLRKVMAYQQIQADPKGREMLAARQKSSNRPAVPGTPAGSPQPGGTTLAQYNAMRDKYMNSQPDSAGLATGSLFEAAFGGTPENVNTAAKNAKDFMGSLAPQDQLRYRQLMQADLDHGVRGTLNKIMQVIGPAIATAPLGLGIGGALGALGGGLSNAAGFGAAGTANSGDFMTKLLATLAKNQASKQVKGLADGGEVRKEPKVGTMGPKREGSGGGGLSKQSVADAIVRLHVAAGAAKAASSSDTGRRGNGLSFNTTRALREIDNYSDGGEVTDDESHDATVPDWEDSPDGVPEGVADTVHGALSVGEYVVSADVVEKLGTNFFDHLQESYHTPAAMQIAMGSRS